MILAHIDRITIEYFDEVLVVEGASERDEARIRRAFEQPARVRRSVVTELPGGDVMTEEQLVKVAPGTHEHARAVLAKLRARILFDSGD